MTIPDVQETAAGALIVGHRLRFRGETWTITDIETVCRQLAHLDTVLQLARLPQHAAQVRVPADTLMLRVQRIPPC